MTKRRLPRAPLGNPALSHFTYRLNEMMKSDSMHPRKNLLALRLRLLEDMTQMEDGSLNAHVRTASILTDSGEIGSDNADRDLTIRLLGSKKGDFDQIEAAMQRIADGGYGRCDICGEKIPEARLDAIPYATACVRCESEKEEVLIPIG